MALHGTLFRGIAFVAACIVGPALLSAQTVTIKRESLSLRDPGEYEVPLRTQPVRVLELTAPRDGYVREVFVQQGTKVESQQNALRLDDTRQQLMLERAVANLEAAKLEQKLADETKDATKKALAAERVKAAEAERKLAQLAVDESSIRIPFAGELFRVHVIPGQFVQAGQSLMTLADTSKLVVEIPVDREQLEQEKASLKISIEKTEAPVTVKAVLPPAAQFEPLRTLVNSLASAIVEVDNTNGQFHAGQTVFTSMIPREPFAPIPKEALQTEAGNRHVQVLRNGVVRNVIVRPLTEVGEEQIFVSGPFTPGDELIVSATPALKDGQQVRPQVAEAGTAAAGATAPGTAAKPAAPATRAPRTDSF